MEALKAPLPDEWSRAGVKVDCLQEPEACSDSSAVDCLRAQVRCQKRPPGRDRPFIRAGWGRAGKVPAAPGQKIRPTTSARPA